MAKETTFHFNKDSIMKSSKLYIKFEFYKLFSCKIVKYLLFYEVKQII